MVAGTIKPLRLVGSGSQVLPHRPLLHALEHTMASGDLQDSELAPVVLNVLRQETDLKLGQPFNAQWIVVGIRVADSYFRPIRLSAGTRDWQRDFAKTATPILVSVARSLQRSADAQAVIVKLCEAVAQRLRLELSWPDESDELNDVLNAIYRECLDAHEIESDEVLLVLQQLTVRGPR